MLEARFVFFDTNIFFTKRFEYTSRAFQRLIDIVRIGLIQVLQNSIVSRELRANIEEQLVK